MVRFSQHVQSFHLGSFHCEPCKSETVHSWVLIPVNCHFQAQILKGTIIQLGNFLTSSSHKGFREHKSSHPKSLGLIRFPFYNAIQLLHSSTEIDQPLVDGKFDHSVLFPAVRHHILKQFLGQFLHLERPFAFLLNHSQNFVKVLIDLSHYVLSHHQFTFDHPKQRIINAFFVPSRLFN